MNEDPITPPVETPPVAPIIEEKKNPEGRPPIWTDPLELKQLVFDYFTTGKGKDRPTLAGLALALKIDRKTLYNYEKKDEFFYIIKEARERVETIYEDRLVYESQPTGVIFALKNMGWADNQNIDHRTLGKPINMGIVSYQDTVKPDEV